MNDPIKIYKELKETYLKYISCGIPFFDEHYDEERKELLKETSTICQPPIIEIVPKYKEHASLEDFCTTEHLSTDLSEFVQCGLFYNETSEKRILYKHQYQSLKEAFINRKHIVVTTGTGSGKTECFLLPVFADLIKESKDWDKNRHRAMRTMILYPLNALAEDQMIRLRKSLNSRNPNNKGALDWLDANRNGHRFYFGRYTGSTPVSGNGDSAKAKIRQEKTSLIEDWKAAKKAAEQTGQYDLLYHIPCMENDSAELWDRISMQQTPPDILITNYSMLNVMLMRNLESPIFNETKKWLAEDSTHVFHLVIDELHTYRGTAGTEVAYLIRVLLDRLGLTPDSPQIQFLASSASMGENEQTSDFLCEFFGVDIKKFKDKFCIFSNDKEEKQFRPEISLPIESLLNYSDTSLSEEQREINLFNELDCTSYYDVSKKFQLANWFKYAMTDEYGSLKAKSILEIASCLNIENKYSVPVVSAILKILCQSKGSKGYIIPLRAHFFFRAINGLWACSNPNCSCVDPKYDFDSRMLGKLYKNPKSTCPCGHNVLEVIICENCGEAFLGGYIISKNGSTYITAEKPITAEFCNYGVIWKANGKYEDWKRIDYNSETGELYDDPHGKYLLHIQMTNNEPKYPNKCPQCEIQYRIEDKNSFTPLKRHSTGLQKVNQVLADALIRTMKQSNEKSTKVVLFSDSRQSAAKLAAGIELDHYRDVVRWLMLKALQGDDDIISFLKNYQKPDAKISSREENDKLTEIRNQEMFVELIDLIRNKTWGLTEEEQVRFDNMFKNVENVGLENITADVFKGLLKIGTNPAGPKPSMAEYQLSGKWHNLFDFNSFTVKPDLGDICKEFYNKIRIANSQEQMMSLFAHKKKSFESMKLGYVTFSSSYNIAPKDSQLINSIIRILGEKRRIKGFDSKYPIPNSFPRAVRNIVKKVYGLNSQQQQTEKLNEIKQLMRQMGIIDPEIVALTGQKIAFNKSVVGMDYWICPRCKTIHMQPSNGICINCQYELGKAHILKEADLVNSDDYYLSLVNSTNDIYRLHCEEMSGQTSRQESRKRQRYFQDIFLTNENSLVNGIDLLSVTTTMEAGVDIGSLSAVIMGNVPPQRFNYQQRVGRAGRRGNPLSIALTIAKGASHDIANYLQPARMISSTPKDPYLETRTKEIAERIIYKEILYNALSSTTPNAESVHGNFGLVSNWETINKGIVEKWIQQNDIEIHHIIDVVTKCTLIKKDEKLAIFEYIKEQLTNRISEIANSNEYNQIFLSERLANAGLLPMFGFPTRTRNLYLSEPNKLPAEDVVNRDIEMAFNSFAPGHEIVKDKKVFKAVGVVDYEYNHQHIVLPKYDSLNKLEKPLYRCSKCGYSTMTLDNNKEECPICSNKMDKIKVCSPLGFCIDYEIKPKDFNGSYDWYSPNSEIKLDCEDSLSDCPSVNNLNIKNNTIPTKGLVHQINDNNGDLYKMGLNDKSIWVDRNAYPKEMQSTLDLKYEQDTAFVISKTTGVLTLSINAISEQICLNPLSDNINYKAVKSAYLSWGHLVRRSVANYLDIDASELEVGYNVSTREHIPEIFFVEKLENGSGYCNYLSGRRYNEVPYEAFIEPLIEGGSVYEQLCSEPHITECSSSCYDCIRDYSNQRQHQLLNWRLGLDLARLSYDNKSKIDFDINYWKSYIENSLSILIKNKNSNLVKGNYLYIIKCTDNNIRGVLIHPLWSENYIQNLLMKEHLPSDTKIVSIYDIEHNL